MIRKTFILLLLIAAIILVFVACGPSDDRASGGESPTSVGGSNAESSQATTWPDTAVKFSLPMGYIPDPQYAPFYVAVEKGYFAEEGFDVDFDYSFETDGLALVGAGEVPFAIVSGEQVILARAQDIPVVYVLEWFQRFPVAIISKAESGIEKTEDLRGRHVGIPGFFGASYVGIAGLLAANGLALEDLEASDIGFSQVESLLTDQVEAVVGYANNEPLQLEALGQQVNVIYVADEADLVANGLIASEQLISSNPEMVAAFVRATLRGIADAIDDPDEAFEISKRYVEGLDDSRKNVLEASIELWRAERLGITELESWERTQDALLQIGFLDEPIGNLGEAFSNEFVTNNQP
ncbi:MAG TPA: ABC transporter substrate-binding protein [candidate division Zixibacteria bacterium]|nr:ABC transporter substrate-binding protein [candidate division Zixibacteria bacterium]